MENNIKSDGLNLNLNTSLTEDVARALLSAVSSATPVQSPTTTAASRPSVVFSSQEENSGSPLQQLQKQVSKILKGFSSPPEVRGAYNPEDLTSQKRQWARFQLKSLDNRPTKEPSRVFESMVVVGLHPQVDAQSLEPTILARDEEDVRRPRNLINRNNQVHAASNLEPQILFAYPPDKPLPLKYKDLLSFCLPGGVQVRAVERTPSFSELNEILLGQEQLKESNQSFVFRLQVADDSTLYGCCVLVEEIVQRPSSLISMLMAEKPSFPSLSRYIMTTPRCYCILSRLPFFDLHFGVLRSILIEERLEWLTEGLDMLNLVSAEETYVEDEICKRSDSSPEPPSDTVDRDKDTESNVGVQDETDLYGNDEKIDSTDEKSSNGVDLTTNSADEKSVNGVVDKDHVDGQKTVTSKDELFLIENKELESDSGSILPLLRSWLYEGSDSSSSSPYEERNFRSEIHEIDSEEPSSAGHEDSITHTKILQWAKDNNYGSLQVMCEFYQLKCPKRGSSLTFQPLDHLHPLNFQRPSEAVLHIAGSTIDVRSLNTSLELAEVHNALLAEEESTALSVWAVACICGSLRLEHVITFFAAALLEKQIVFICSNLGVLSASVLSIIPLIRPYQWQSLLMPVLPNDMLDFLDAPVPFIVGVQNKTADLHSRLTNAVIIDVNKNQIKSGSIPQFPQQKELIASLRPYHSMLVGESYLARRRPVYECTDVQVEAAKGFLAVLRSYLDSLCANLRSHTITNVQSNNDKVSLLLRESFLGSFPYRERAFMKLFVDTQLFSVHTDFVLSFYQKD
ncbi:hypothetical protein LUZ61_002864 [Rhynchospora tenuis]|uniref:UDENN domain-containing protein n=1 Tax=Rhynchospora tenuis TaxID=198213 RepID=A0AAD6ES77_9POAL|nr:hypothetical protein LUZ61_002864 [Rhynchospora tenuis]